MPRYVSKLRIENYKCYRSAEVELAPGINVVVGKNDSGKTALLEVLAFAGKANASPVAGPSRADFELTVGREYFVENVTTSDLPLPSAIFKNERGFASDQDFLNWLFDQPDHTFRGQYEIGKRESPWNFKCPTIKTYEWEVRGGDFSRLDWMRDTPRPRATGSSTVKLPSSDFGSLELEKCPLRTFYFSPDRITAQDSRHSTDGVLKTDGSNLAGVVSFLQGVRGIERYLKLVQQVFPDFKAIHARNRDDDHAEVTLWPVEDQEQRAIRLQDSGRGIAPVLAILYILNQRSNDPSMIVVDEPQAFLHPEALRRLLGVFRQHPQHQFILATHSPIVVTAAGVEKCLIVSKVHGESTIRIAEPSKTAHARMVLSELGASLQDVFGAEGVVWVEGPTEQCCFERILASDSSLTSKGLTILPLRATGDLDGRQRAATAEIYRRLSQSNALMPPAVAFQFDREDRSEGDQQAMARQMGAPCFFTKRRMYENYLLNAPALAALVNALDSERASPVRIEEIEEFLEKEREAWQVKPSRKQGQEWSKDANSVEVLQKLFHRFTESRFSYNKTVHGPQLTSWLIENSPEDLKELRDLLRSILEVRTPE